MLHYIGQLLVSCNLFVLSLQARLQASDAAAQCSNIYASSADGSRLGLHWTGLLFRNCAVEELQ